MMPLVSVIVLITHPRIMREMMLTAHALEMTNGEYVFLAGTITRVPTRGPITWKFGDGRDEMAFEAFRSLITYVNVEPDWNKTADWVEGIAETARVSFNTTYTEDQKYNEYALSAYEVMLASAQVFQENINATSMDGRQYAKYFWNRVFQFPSRNMTIGPYGSSRLPPISSCTSGSATCSSQPVHSVNHKLWLRDEGGQRCIFSSECIFRRTRGNMAVRRSRKITEKLFILGKLLAYDWRNSTAGSSCLWIQRKPVRLDRFLVFHRYSVWCPCGTVSGCCFFHTLLHKETPWTAYRFFLVGTANQRLLLSGGSKERGNAPVATVGLKFSENKAKDWSGFFSFSHTVPAGTRNVDLVCMRVCLAKWMNQTTQLCLILLLHKR
ncbi:hypothetical protein RvY_13348-1 [Ramazzottius varieornatus]|uniref:Receptor ligand binding region domain-containing protein n=1 Tax=Ramazzottius varieornatus TaxID=947166 RepID=A0A1D1VPF2_RAMVA|nr:hypothetical protein RvY_13348-1 [Ramazzottius varieornatus]